MAKASRRPNHALESFRKMQRKTIAFSMVEPFDLVHAPECGDWQFRHIAVESAKFKSLKIQYLTVTRLRVAEVTVSNSIKLPERTNRRIAG